MRLLNDRHGMGERDLGSYIVAGDAARVQLETVGGSSVGHENGAGVSAA